MGPDKTLILFNYTVDSLHPVLSHQLDVAVALCEKFRKVVVITAGPKIDPNLPNLQVISIGWEQEKTFRNVFSLYRVFLSVLKSEKYVVVFSHMTEVQSALIGPITKLLNIKHVLWYAHAHHSIGLRISNLFVDKIVTSTSGSCPIRGKKVLIIGQAINPTQFPSKEFSFKFKNFTHIGRFDSSKRIDLIIDFCLGLRRSGIELNLDLIGSSSNAKNLNWARNLQTKASGTEYEGWLKFESGVPRDEVMLRLQRSDVFVHAFQGSLDKTLVEATFMMLPVLTINHEYHQNFGSWSPVNSPTLEDEYRGLMSKTSDELRNELARRKNLALNHHGFQGWINRVSETLLF